MTYSMKKAVQYYSFFLNVLEVYGYAVVENGLWCSEDHQGLKTLKTAIPAVGDRDSIAATA